MQAGQLRHRVTFLVAQAVEAPRGSRTKTFLPLLRNVPARVLPLQGEEREVAQRIAAGVTHEYVTRYYAALAARSPKDLRLQHGGKTYEVGYQVDPEGRKRKLMGTAKEISA